MAVVERFQRLRIVSDKNFLVWGQWTGEDPPSPGAAIVLEWIARCELKPIIIVDSFIRFHPGVENSATETQEYMNMFRRLAAAGATVILLHHIGKAETAQDYRGSSDIKASADIAYKLSTIGDASRLCQLELRAFKQRISVTSRFHIRYEDGHFTADAREPIKTVTERLVELLKANPGLTGDKFEKLATANGLGRNRGREFLTLGIEAGTIRVEREGNRRTHFCRESTEGNSRAHDSWKR
jgi:hypothetical protein